MTIVLTIVDQGPLLPAVIKPVAEESGLWSSLQSLDPIFTRELPPTEKALTFYAKNIEKCLQAKGRNNEYAAPSVAGDSSGKPIGIIFDIRTYKKVSARQ